MIGKKVFFLSESVVVLLKGTFPFNSLLVLVYSE